MPELKFIAVAFAIGVAGFGAAFGIGRIVAQAIDSTGRNPEAGGKIFNMMILGAALVEAIAIYALVLSFMMLK
ncbi:MAG: ATP synthase F0 subunit C [Candidatus Paceibacterota bacterium]|jgi:F-type H+-transporting ATPase subunit c